MEHTSFTHPESPSVNSFEGLVTRIHTEGVHLVSSEGVDK